MFNKQSVHFSLFIVLISCLAYPQCRPNNSTHTFSPNAFSPDISANDIHSHIKFLASDSLQGRESGSEFEAMAANYIIQAFEQYGVEPKGNDGTFLQDFTINIARLTNPHASDDTKGERRVASNVIGWIPGRSNTDYIIIGAHYDHLGYGSFGSLYSGTNPRIHNGADDNASGTAGLLELAHYFSENPPEDNLLLLAFSGEEMGLLGSANYVEEPTIDLAKAKAMINMDMIGRMSDKNLFIFGIGTTPKWSELVTAVNNDSLNLNLVEDGTGASDHTSFYYKNIPVLHYFTGTHSDYHRPSDDLAYIEEEGQELVVTHVAKLINALGSLSKEELPFIEAPGKQRQTMTFNGPTLGVLPDYGFEGLGMRITGINPGQPAHNAGLQSGDIIVALGETSFKDIYGYMGVLNTLKIGQKITITIVRDGKEQTLDLQL
tara:strand:+ start:10526 stop:11824 length:1299 start_codon:yes stop_codon:yes gene_type:complete